MRQFAFYVAELDMICLLTVMPDCAPAFEFGPDDLYELSQIINPWHWDHCLYYLGEA